MAPNYKCYPYKGGCYFFRSQAVGTLPLQSANHSDTIVTRVRKTYPSKVSVLFRWLGFLTSPQAMRQA